MDKKALHVLNMNKDFGCKVPVFNPSKMIKQEDYLGKYSYPHHKCKQLIVNDK